MMQPMNKRPSYYDYHINDDNNYDTYQANQNDPYLHPYELNWRQLICVVKWRNQDDGDN
jgi:hypothetical protein